MKKIFGFLVGLVAVAVLLCGAAMLIGHRITEGQTNLRGVYVGDLPVGGLTREQTEKQLIDRGWKDREQTPLKVTTLRGESFEVDPVRSGLVPTVDSMVEKAYQVGHDADMLTNLVTAFQTLREPVDVSRGSGQADAEYLYGLIDACQEKLRAAMPAEEYSVDAKAGKMTVVKGREAIELDREGFRSAIETALLEGKSELSYTRLLQEPTMPDFAAIHKTLEREPADAYYTDDGTFNVVDEVVGCRFDTAQAESLWNAAAAGDEVQIPLDITWPKVTGEQLRGQLYRDLLGACLTKFPNSGENRRNNLKLCAEKIDEYVLYPGEVFSYNTVVGERTEAGGFLPAPAYVNGDEKEEIGGGACQISSTLYAATAFAFLETVDRTCHMFKVSYMQMGTDATVTIPDEGKAIDFQFRNSKNYPIKIRTIFNNEESTIQVEIWGTLEDDDYMPVEFDNSYTWEHDFDMHIPPAYPDREGYKIKLLVDLYTAPEGDSYVYRTLTHRLVINESGETVDDTIINSLRENSDQYAMDTYHQHP